ncbi:hypothetical protein [Faecalimonas sp.]
MGVEVLIPTILAGASAGYSAYEQNKQGKKAEAQMNKQMEEERKKLDKEQKKKKEQTLGFYESLRGGNVSMLAPKQDQVIG